jgi:hypothetical protein
MCTEKPWNISKFRHHVFAEMPRIRPRFYAERPAAPFAYDHVPSKLLGPNLRPDRTKSMSVPGTSRHFTAMQHVESLLERTLSHAHRAVLGSARSRGLHCLPPRAAPTGLPASPGSACIKRRFLHAATTARRSAPRARLRPGRRGHQRSRLRRYQRRRFAAGSGHVRTAERRGDCCGR